MVRWGDRGRGDFCLDADATAEPEYFAPVKSEAITPYVAGRARAILPRFSLLTDATTAVRILIGADMLPLENTRKVAAGWMEDRRGFGCNRCRNDDGGRGL